MYRVARSRTYQLFTPDLGGRIGHLTDWFILLLIVANVSAVILETVDSLSASYGWFFYRFELFSVAVFTAEYVGRVWAAVENEDYDHPLWGRLRFSTRPLLVVDLLAIVPFYLLALGVFLDLRFLRALRLIRLLRLLKLARYSDSIRAFGKVLETKKPDLVIALFANGLLLVLASSVMYYVESRAQPEVFGSIPETMWWGVATLTTVGYGDAYPVTPLGQFVAAIVAVLGIGLFALPASILASGFIQVAREESEKKRYRYCPHCGERLGEERQNEEEV